MGFKNKERLTIAFLLLLAAVPFPAHAQKERADSLVRLMKAESLQLIERNGLNYRKAVDATFLHNGTYLICDSALWSVENKIINAEGHVRIIQDETILTSDRLDYLVDENLAKFRGSLVQLQDKEKNTLRTHHLDYNTKDSVAVFKNGGALLSHDGQIMESVDGRYESSAKRFIFNKNVNMFTDSIFVKTSSLGYDTEPGIVKFYSYVDFWKDGDMLSAGHGWYDRPKETFFFNDNVHGTTENQEAWSDSLYFYRKRNDVLLLGNAQVQDTTRNVYAVADYIFYQDSLARVTLCRNAAVAMRTREKEKVDTVYFGADTLVYNTVRKCDVPSGELSAAKSRLEDMMTDPVSEYRSKAAEEAARRAEEAEKEDPMLTKKRPPRGAHGRGPVEPEAPVPPAGAPEEPASPQEEPEQKQDTEVKDTIPAAPVIDTTRIGFFMGRGKVRVFRPDIQVRCDSIRYCDLDSIARLYIDPIVWNEGNRQYAADSIHLLVRNGGADRASLMSNAFIITEENTAAYDQIKSTEVMAYFDTTGALKRFDALGGASALFYLKENDALATANKVESKLLSASFVNGDIDRIHYYDSPKNDAYPVAQLKASERVLKGFNWLPENRPKDRNDVTSLEVKPSEREEYAAHPKPVFSQMDIYFPGHMEKLYRDIAVSDSLKSLPKPAQENATEPSDTAQVDTTRLKDAAPEVCEPDGAASDTLSKAPAKVLDNPAGEEREKDSKADAAQARRAAREAKWAELDARDKARAEAKAQKALEKKRARTKKLVLEQRRQDEKDNARLERYKKRFERKKARALARKKTNLTNEDNGTDTQQVSQVRVD